MNKLQLSFTADDGREIPYTLWTPEGDVRAVVQVVHGMTEHRGRYDAVAASLCAHGIAAAAHDLRGHGENPTDGAPEGVAALGEDGWNRSKSDLCRMAAILRTRFVGVPHILLGFSLGSFLVRTCLGEGRVSADGTVLIGTGQQPSAVLAMICAVVRTQIKRCGIDGTTSLVRKLSFETYNARFAPYRTTADWLCADASALDAYLADALCRPDISAGLFYDLLSAMREVGGKRTYEKWNRSCPILLLSGADDPVGDNGRGVRAVHRAMKAAGLADVQMYLYPNARHDLLHESAGGQADAAMQDLIAWVEWMIAREKS